MNLYQLVSSHLLSYTYKHLCIDPTPIHSLCFVAILHYRKISYSYYPCCICHTLCVFLSDMDICCRTGFFSAPTASFIYRHKFTSQIQSCQHHNDSRLPPCRKEVRKHSHAVNPLPKACKCWCCARCTKIGI